MAKKKKKKTGGLFGFFSKKKKTGRKSKKNQPTISAGVKVTLGIMAVTIIAAGGALGLFYMDHFVKYQQQPLSINTEFSVRNPTDAWLQQEQAWVDMVYSVAGEVDNLPTEDIAKTVQQRLTQISWLYDIVVELDPQPDNCLKVNITAGVRRPVAIIEVRRQKYYLDHQMFVFEYKPLDFLKTPEITGFSLNSKPTLQNTLNAEDIEAGINLIDYLLYCDSQYLAEKKTAYPISPQLYEIIQKNKYLFQKLPNITVSKPLVTEIKRIDVSNCQGRKSSTKPHIIMYPQDGTPIEWGAALGQSTFYVEAYGEKKVENLYKTFINNNHSLDLKDKLKRLKLWPPQDISRPR